MERHIKVKVIYDVHESQKRKAHCFMPCRAMHRGPHWRRAMGVSSAKQVGRGERERERERERGREGGSVGKCLYWESG